MYFNICLFKREGMKNGKNAVTADVVKISKLKSEGVLLWDYLILERKKQRK